MVSLHRSVVGVTFIIVCINISANAKKNKYICPIGFSLAHTKDDDDDPICYWRKGPESFEDKFKDCTGNLFTSKFYHSLNFTEPNLVLWTDYKSMYPGGPFVDQSFTDSTGDILYSTFEVKYDQSLGLEEELCVVIDPVTNFTAVRCNENHYRYCFVKPYEKDVDRDGCEIDGYWRFYRPKATCLTALTGVGGGTVRANWRQAKELCGKRRGTLLSRGWRYANNPLMSTTAGATFPLGIILSPDNTIRYDTSYAGDEIPTSEWFFENKSVGSDTSLGALRDNFWYMVNGSYIFYDVICERPIRILPVDLNVYVDEDNKIILKTNDTIYERFIRCFTDSITFYPIGVRVRYDDRTNSFILKPVADGYYWCVNIDSKNHIVSESNKALFIREKQSLINTYASLLHLEEKYELTNLSNAYKDWEKKLEEYVFYRTNFINVYGDKDLQLQSNVTVGEIIKSYKDSSPSIKLKENKMVYKLKIKRLFLDAKQVLAHVQMNPEMIAAGPGRWEDLTVEYMKPVYFCRGIDSVPTMALGSSHISGCQNYTCVGDFDRGVQWLITAVEDCSVPVTLSIRVVSADVFDDMPTAGPPVITTSMGKPKDNNSSEEEEVTTTEAATITPKWPRPPKPTTTTVAPEEQVSTVTMTSTPRETITTVVPVMPTTLAPDEQLQQVIDNLEALVQNTSVPVTVHVVEQAFDQVDELLDLEDDLNIPGNFLHLIDALAGRVDLNGTHQSATVRGNIALVLADADPGSPVRGLRIAATDEDMFTDGAFEIISDEVNETQLATNTSEAVVHLPESVANSSRRISFVIFRNDRAFKASNETYFVNSRVLSIKVENLTQFENGEVIDIHLTPILDVYEQNQSRSCAYWHFNDDGSGYWSQDGCTFIPSDEDGMLDTCRCDHLTHFAEVLVPRTIFSDRNEKVLEILSIICCVMSLLGLFMIGLTAAMFRSWRRDYNNKIWLQLCISIFFVVICFLIIVFTRFDVYNVPCMLLGVGLHYSVLASFCWMLVAAVLSYRRLVIVFSREASHKLLRASAFSWGAPCAIVGILLSVDPHAYSGQFEENSLSGTFCYPSGLALWLTVYAPIAVMLVANWVLFALIVRSVFASRRIQRHGDANEALRCASVSCLLVFLFGLPWVFGLFAFNVVAAYFFTLTATLQGFVLFMFFVLGNKKTRDLWLNKLKIKQTRKVPVTSSTYTHRSNTGPGYRPGLGASSIEANSQKPRSLTSPDNSRFS